MAPVLSSRQASLLPAARGRRSGIRGVRNLPRLSRIAGAAKSMDRLPSTVLGEVHKQFPQLGSGKGENSW